MSSQPSVTVRWRRPVPGEGFDVGGYRIRRGRVGDTLEVPPAVARVLLGASEDQASPWVEIVAGHELLNHVSPAAEQPVPATVDEHGLPLDPGELREHARAMAERLQRIDAAEAEPLVTVRWIKDAQPGMGQINGRTYSGRGPTYRRRRMEDGNELVVLDFPGDVQQLPRGAAQALHHAGYITGASPQDDQAIYST